MQKLKTIVCATMICTNLLCYGTACGTNNTIQQAAVEATNTTDTTLSETSVTTTTKQSTTTTGETSTTTKSTTKTTQLVSTTKSKATTSKTTTLTQTYQQCLNNIPYFDQTQYKHIPYGKYGTISSHGCGVVCLSMIATYIYGEGYAPDDIAGKLGKYNTSAGSVRALFTEGAEMINLQCEEMVTQKKKVIEALQAGKLVISAQKNSIFSEGGHFILLTGIDKNGKIFVNDPFGPNYNKSEKLKKGFKEGFAQKDVLGYGVYWIYNTAPATNQSPAN